MPGAPHLPKRPEDKDACESVAFGAEFDRISENLRPVSSCDVLTEGVSSDFGNGTSLWTSLK